MQRSIGLEFTIGAGLWVYASQTRLNQLLLFRRWFLLALKAGVSAGRKLVLELLDTTGGVDELQFSSVERMAHVADVDLQLFPRAARLEAVATPAGDLRFEVLGMNAIFHDLSLFLGGVGLDTTRGSITLYRPITQWQRQILSGRNTPKSPQTE